MTMMTMGLCGLAYCIFGIFTRRIWITLLNYVLQRMVVGDRPRWSDLYLYVKDGQGGTTRFAQALLWPIYPVLVVGSASRGVLKFIGKRLP